MQAQFKEAHKAYEKATSTGGAGGQQQAPKASPAELRREIAQLEDERTQLVEKIAGLKKRTADVVSVVAHVLCACPLNHISTCVQPGFAGLLDATSKLRKEQEEEAKLGERMQEQRLALQAAERRYADVNRRLAETRAATVEELSATAVLEAARREASEGRQVIKFRFNCCGRYAINTMLLMQLVRTTLPAQLAARRETLGKLQRILSEAPIVRDHRSNLLTHFMLHPCSQKTISTTSGMKLRGWMKL